MPSWQGKSRGSHLGYRIFVYVLKSWGLGPSYLLLRLVSFYYFLFSFGTSKVLFRYFRQRIGFGVAQSILNIYANYYLFGQTLIDKVAVFTNRRSNLTYEFEGEHHLRDLVKAGRGGLLLSAHVGNWEIAGHLLQRLQTSIHIVMFDGEQKRIKDLLRSVGAETSAHIIVIQNDLSHIFQITEALKKNELVCIHADRYLQGNKVVWAKFLGAEAAFPAGPFMLAYSLGSSVSFTFAMKEGKTHYHFFASAPKKYDHWEKNTAVSIMLEDFSSALEEKTKKYPTQWYNYFDFWQK